MKTIGKVDIVDFPELELFNVPIKVDTGAYTSTIHCHKIMVDGDQLHCVFKHLGSTYQYVFNEFKTKNVKSSNGIHQQRYEVKTKIKVYNKTYKININLSKRSKMKYPVLLGRKFLKGKFIVDVRLSNASYNLKNQ